MKGIQNTSTNNYSTLIGNNKKFIVPKFQRDYSWSSEQWDDLWQDIETMIAEKDDHYMGYLVLQTNDDKTFYIIDGQQRFTTVTILILAAIKCIKTFVNNGIEIEDNQQRVENLLRTYIGFKDPVTLVYDNILVLNRNNDGYFRDYIVKLEELRVRNLKNSEKLMKQCFEFFEQRLRGKYNEGKDYALFIQTVVNKLYFTQIVVNDEMNAFRVFETLNARGVQLSSSDLLKNYLFSLVDKNNTHPSRIETLEEKWAKLTDNIKSEKLPEFLRYYWNAGHKSIRANALFKTIRKDINTDQAVFYLVDDLYRYSDVYMALTDSNDALWQEMDVRKYVGLLNAFHLKQPFSILMTAKLHLSDSEFKKLFKNILYICFRYNVICDRNPNDQDAPFNMLAMLITKENRVDYQLLSPIIIDDSVFENSFSDKSFPYTSRNAKIVRYILATLEKHDGSTKNISFTDEDATIEHILPQNADDSWEIDEEKQRQMVFRLGNTCLLEKKLNLDIKNTSFQEKATKYAMSSYLEAKKIATKTSWTENDIINRQRHMAHVAVNIWKTNF